MTDGRAPRTRAVCDDDPLQPDDRRTDCEWRADVDALYRDRADQLIGHFASMTSDRETARDFVHEAFARFTALAFPRRLAIARPDAYLFRMCANLMRDWHRAQRGRAGHCDVEPEAVHSPFAELEHRDTLRRLEAAVLRLKPKTREIFLAKRLDGMTYLEIAERTGLSVKGVEKHMSKAIAAIDRAMDRDCL